MRLEDIFTYPVVIFILTLISYFGVKYLIKLIFKLRRSKEKSIAFFHPYCNAGGGGERVLWAALLAIQTKYPNYECWVYTGDTDATAEQILDKTQKRFNIKLLQKPRFIFLQHRSLVEASNYPYFTMLGQSLGSIVLGLEALWKACPHIYFDTMGYAFTLPIFKFFGGCNVGCYVHYPTISTDMLTRVASQSSTHNNPRFIANNPNLTHLKLYYYRIFAYLYNKVGSTAEVVMVNSSWTKNHIASLWSPDEPLHLVYPPCWISDLKDIPVSDDSDNNKETRILSIAQFRPEKDHSLQLTAFSELIRKLPKGNKVRLILAGGCRNTEDEQRVSHLKKMTQDLEIDDRVEFKVNLTFEELKKEMELATIGLHTMWNEHFGIGVVDCMAAGLIMVAHNSGGPKMDIIVENQGQPTGFLASTSKEFADTIRRVIQLSTKEKMNIIKNARKHIEIFSEDKFEESFLKAIHSLFEV